MCASHAHIVIPQKSVKYFDWDEPIRRDGRRRRSASDIWTRATQRPHPFFAVARARMFARRRQGRGGCCGHSCGNVFDGC